MSELMKNWPKSENLQIEDLSRYCTPVQDAIINWLKRNKEDILLNKYLNKKSDINPDELDKIKEIYSEQCDLIIMLSELNQ